MLFEEPQQGGGGGGGTRKKGGKDSRSLEHFSIGFPQFLQTRVILNDDELIQDSFFFFPALG